MESNNELMKVVQQLADEEGITFEDACKVAVKAIRFEIERRKKFTGELASGKASSLR